MKIGVLALVIIFFVFIGPFLAIWSLNTLFPALDIQYTLETWAAALILTGTIKAKAKND